MAIPYVNVRDFTPNAGRWTPVGTIESMTQVGNTFLLTLVGGERSLQVSFLSPTAFRVRFDPSPGADYSSEVSVAVVTRALGPVTLTIAEKTSETLLIDTGAMQVRIDLRPYR